MAKERYLPNLAFQPYVAPQQELPVEEFNNLGVVLNQRYDQNIAKWDELDAYMNQVQLSEADQSIKDSVIKDTRNVIQDIRKNGNWENGKLQIREVAKRLANDQALSIGQQNFKKAQEQQDIEAKMRMQGINLIDFNQGRFNQATIDPNTGRARVLDYSGTEKLQDFDSRRKTLFEGLTPDGFDNESSSPRIDEARGMIFQVGSGSSARYVSAKKVREIASRNLNNYLETQEGQQEYKMLTTSNSMNPIPLDAATAKKQILEGITNTGMTRVFSQTGNKSSTSITASGLNGAGGAGAPPPPNTEEALPIEKSKFNPTYSSLADKLSHKRDGYVGKTYQGAGAGIMGAMNTTGFERKPQGLQPLDKEETKAFNKIAGYLGIKKGASGYANKDIAAIRDFATKRIETATAPTYRAFTEEEIAKNNAYVANGNLKARGFYDVESGDFVEYKNLPTAVKEALNGKKTGEIQFSGVINADNHFYDMAKDSKREAGGAEGWLRPQYISIAGKSYAVTSNVSDYNKSDIEFARAANRVSSSNRYGVPVKLKGPKGEVMYTSPSATRGLYDIKDDSGKLLYQLPLNDVAQAVTRGMQIEE